MVVALQRSQLFNRRRLEVEYSLCVHLILYPACTDMIRKKSVEVQSTNGKMAPVVVSWSMDAVSLVFGSTRA